MQRIDQLGNGIETVLHTGTDPPRIEYRVDGDTVVNIDETPLGPLVTVHMTRMNTQTELIRFATAILFAADRLGQIELSRHGLGATEHGWRLDQDRALDTGQAGSVSDG